MVDDKFSLLNRDFLDSGFLHKGHVNTFFYHLLANNVGGSFTMLTIDLQKPTYYQRYRSTSSLYSFEIIVIINKGSVFFLRRKRETNSILMN